MNRPPRESALFVRMTLMARTENVGIVGKKNKGAKVKRFKPGLFQCHTGGQSKLQGRTIKSRGLKMSIVVFFCRHNTNYAQQGRRDPLSSH